MIMTFLLKDVIPMLPEVLSNELCSIRQDEDKLAFSTIFKIDEKTGKTLDTWFGRTIIRSDKRFSYEEAQETIDLAAQAGAKSGLFYTELQSLMDLSKTYTGERYDKGALSMDADEVRFVLDEAGVPIKVMIKKTYRYDAHDRGMDANGEPCRCD
jgi:ribonuclease R